MGVKVQTASKPSAQGGSAQAPAQARIPFVRGSRMKENLSLAPAPFTLAAGAVPFGPLQVPANGFLRALNIEFAVTSSGNSATVVVSADAPFNLINQISVVTSSGDSLLVPIDGYALAMLIKYGGFSGNTPLTDPRADPTYANFTAGAGATAGTGVFRLRVPFEIDQSSGFCSLPNLAANRSYNIQGIFSPLGTIFTTVPNGTVTVTVTVTAEYWSVPGDTNAQGDPQETSPFGNGSFHVTQVETIVIAAGGGIYQLHNVGNVIRQIIMIQRTAAGVRTTQANLPATLELVLNNDLLLYQTRNELFRNIAAAGYGAQYGAVGAAVNTPQGQDSGVIPFLQFSAPGQSQVRGETPRNQLLPTLDATLLQVRGTTWDAAGTLQVITSSIVPTSASALYAPHF